MKKILLSLILSASAIFTATAQHKLQVHLADGTTKEWKVWEVKSINFVEETPLPAPMTDSKIDLGLSVYWSPVNLGANESTEAGNNYGWGDVTGLNQSKDLKFFPYDGVNTNITGSDYDMAKAAWGTTWRLPVEKDFQELIDNCDAEEVEGGYIFRSKKNDAELFLPFVNYREGDAVKEDKGLYYWTGEIAEDKSKAVCFNNSAFDSMPRYMALAVRPVYDKFSINVVGIEATYNKATISASLVNPNNVVSYGIRIAKGEADLETDQCVVVELDRNVDGKDVDNPVFEIENLETNTEYFFKLFATAEDGETVYTEVQTLATAKYEFLITHDTTTVTFYTATITATLMNPDRVAGYGIKVAASVSDLNNPKNAGITNITKSKQGTDNLTFDVKGLSPHKEYYFYMYAYNEKKDTIITETESFVTDYEYVDLGVGILWAKWNVGAESEGSYGGYYAWGELETKSVYNAANYPLNFDIPITGNNEENTLTLPIDVLNRKIGNVDGYMLSSKNQILDISGTEYDVARAKWGGKWRMPTKEEWKKLSQYCSWEYVTIPGTSTKAFKVSNKVNANLFIYLPAGGEKKNSSTSELNKTAYYWSSTLWTYTEAIYYGQKVFDMKCDSENISNRNFADYTDRFYGCLIRPVKDK